MGKLHRKILRAFGLHITTGIAGWIRIFLINNPFHTPGKIFRIPCLIQDWFPQPYTRMVTVTANHITYIIINPFGKNGFVIPELPSRSIHDNKQAKFITGIHKSRVLRTMCITDYFQPQIFQFLGITPVNTIGNRISYNCKILMPISSHQRFTIRFSIQPEAIFSLKFDTTDTDATTITVYYISILIINTYTQIIQIR